VPDQGIPESGSDRGWSRFHADTAWWATRRRSVGVDKEEYSPVDVVLPGWQDHFASDLRGGERRERSRPPVAGLGRIHHRTYDSTGDGCICRIYNCLHAFHFTFCDRKGGNDIIAFSLFPIGEDFFIQAFGN